MFNYGFLFVGDLMLISDFIIAVVALVVFSFIAGYSGNCERDYRFMFSVSLSFIAVFAFCSVFLLSYLIATYVIS